MKAFLGLLFFVLTFPAAFAAVPGNAPILTIAAPGQNTQELSIPLSSLSGTGVNGVFSLYGYAASSAGGNFYTFYKNGLAYSTGSTTRAYCSNITAASNSAPVVYFQLVSSQAAIPNNTPTALTNGVYMAGATTLYPMAISSAAGFITSFPGTYVFGDGAHITYPGFQTQAGSSQSYSVHMECYEQ